MPRALPQTLVKDDQKLKAARGPMKPVQATANNHINHAGLDGQDSELQHVKLQLQQSDSQCQRLYEQLEQLKKQHQQEIHAAKVRLAQAQAEHAATAGKLLAAVSELSSVKKELAEACKAAQAAKDKAAATAAASATGEQEAADTAAPADPVKLMINVIDGCGKSCGKSCCQAAEVKDVASVAAPEKEQPAQGKAALQGAEVKPADDSATVDASSNKLQLGQGEGDAPRKTTVVAQRWWLEQPTEEQPTDRLHISTANPSAYLSTLAAEMVASQPSGNPAAATADSSRPAPINIKVIGGTLKSAVGQVKKRMPGNRNSSAASSILAAVKPASSKDPARIDPEEAPLTPSFFRRTSSYAADMIFGRSGSGAGTGSTPGIERAANSNRQAPVFIKLLRRKSRKTAEH